MIEATIKEIRHIEKEFDKCVEKAREEAVSRLKDFKTSCEKEWEGLKTQMQSEKAKVLSRCEEEAHEVLKDIKVEAEKTMSSLQLLSVNKDKIVDSILKNLLKE
jgi:vacuolar-type H+-ATPase subunit H